MTTFVKIIFRLLILEFESGCNSFISLETISASDLQNFQKFLELKSDSVGVNFFFIFSFNSEKSDTTLILFSETKWGEWNCQECSKSCGGGAQVCTRECENGEAGDLGCEGSSRKSEPCNEQDCPGKKLS